VDPAGGGEEGGKVRVQKAAHPIGQGAGGVHHRLGKDLHLLSREAVLHHRSPNPPPFPKEGLGLGVIEGHRPPLQGREDQGQVQAVVGELAVLVGHGPQGGGEVGEEVPHRLWGEVAALAQAPFARKEVVELEARPVVGDLQGAEEGGEEGEGPGQVGGQLQDHLPFPQGLPDQPELAGVQPLHRQLQVAHPPVEELGAPRAGP